jgi:hypothetical protein
VDVSGLMAQYGLASPLNLSQFVGVVVLQGAFIFGIDIQKLHELARRHSFWTWAMKCCHKMVES